MNARIESYKDQIKQGNERLIDSVTKVTELLKANQILREELDHFQRTNDMKDYELYCMH